MSDGMRKRESALVDCMREKKMHLSPRSVHHYPEGGWARLLFSLRRIYLSVGLHRMEEVLGWGRWPGIYELESALNAGSRGSTSDISGDS